jgi:hypothetical protein
MSWQGPLIETITYEYRALEHEGGNLPAIRTGATPIMHEENLYLFCGFGAGVGRSSDVWRYGMKDSMWSIVQTSGNNSDKPTKRDGHSATYLGEGKVLIFGGQGEPSPNERSERTLDIVKTKTWSIRDLYNDLFLYDCNEAKWEMLCPQGAVPLTRRGHSAVYFPKGGYGETQFVMHHNDHHHHNHSHSHHKSQASRSPSKKAGGGGGKKGAAAAAQEEEHHEYDPIPENSVVVFGGSGMEVSKYIEAVYNDVWVFSLDSGRWDKVRCRGVEVKPLFDHRVIRVGHLMVVTGGITATNAKSSKPADLQPNHDVYVLNLKTLSWSTMDVSTANGKPAKLNLHGHSMISDPYDEGIVYLFGGKDTVDGKRASLESVAGAKNLLKRNPHDTHAWQLDLGAGVMSPIPARNLPPETRYEHVAVSCGQEGSFLARPPAPRRKPGTREEPLFLIFGGARVEHFGYCDPDIIQVVRVYSYAFQDMMSQASGSKAPGNKVEDIADDMTISTRHTEGSAMTGLPGLVDEEGDGDLRQPSIWEKKQTMEITNGKSTFIREPSSWAELKLALSVSQTDKRSNHQAGPAASLGASQSLGALEDGGGSLSRPGTSTSQSTEGGGREGSGAAAAGGNGPATDSGGAEMALSAKAMQKKQLKRLRALGQTILPIVKNKSYLAAKSSYFEAYPAPLPVARAYKGKATL